MSSMSNRLLKEYTDKALLSNIRKRSPPNKQYLSLEDLKRLAMKASREETVHGDSTHLFDDRISILETFSATTYHHPQAHKFNETLADQVSRLPVGDQGSGRVEEQVTGAPFRQLVKTFPQLVPFRVSMQDALDYRCDAPFLETPAGQTLQVDTNTSTQQFPELDPIPRRSHSPVFQGLARDGDFNTTPACEPTLCDTDHDTDSLDLFDIQLLGIDCSGDRASLSRMDDSRLSSQDPPPVSDLTHLPRPSKTLAVSHTAKVDHTLSYPKIYNYDLEDCLAMPNPMPTVQPLGNRLGLISRKLEEPIEEVFKGISRPHILY